VEGNWTDKALAQFRHFLNLRRLSVSDAELLGVLRQAREEYFTGDSRVYLCAARPCCDKIGIAAPLQYRRRE
jgi:hypothetical protein